MKFKASFLGMMIGGIISVVICIIENDQTAAIVFICISLFCFGIFAILTELGRKK